MQHFLGTLDYTAQGIAVHTIYSSQNQPIFLFVLSLEYLQSKIETLLAYHVCNHVFLHIDVLQNSITVFFRSIIQQLSESRKKVRVIKKYFGIVEYV